MLNRNIKFKFCTRNASTSSLSSISSTTSYNVAKVLRNYPVGATYHGFKIQRILPVPELSFTAINLTHERTGADYIHIDRNDKNNVFSLAFKTNASDSTGLPHILEHTTLCGSQKYPVRDPFFKMLNRSLSNFMNAMTGHDYTFYPFSTTNQIDYQNLRNIYFDSVFNPILSSEDFYQEGWRLEHQDPQDPNTPIIFKGVVYNEMKGQLSNSSYFFYINFLKSIYPSLNVSGGDPNFITNLFHQDLIDFHSQKYHPSNSKIYSYGDLPLSDNLSFLNDNLSAFGKRSYDSSNSIPVNPIDLSSNKSVTIDGPTDPMLPKDKQFKVSLTWFTGNPKDVYETFCLKILSNLLTDGHSSPFFKQLIEKNIGSDFTVNTGSDSTTNLNSFSIGLQGLIESDIPIFKNKVAEIIDYYYENGFEPSKINAILRQIEINKKDKKSQFGLNLLYSIIPGWVNNIDPFDQLAFNDTLNQFKSEFQISKGNIFKHLIEKYFINKPTFTFIIKPKDNFNDSLITQEKARLNQKIKNLSDDDMKTIQKRGLKLLEKQNSKEDLSSLPTLSVEKDIPAIGEKIPLEFSGKNDNDNTFKILKRITDTNGLTYFFCKKDLTDSIPARLLPYLPLFSECLLNLGTIDKSMAELEDEIKLHTGGFHSSVYIKPTPENNLKPKLYWEITGASLDSQILKIYSIWLEILTKINFNNLEKLKTLIKSLNSNNVSAIADSGSSFATNFVASQLSPVRKFSEYLTGIEQIKFLSKLNKFVDDDEALKENVVSKLIELKKIIINNQKLSFALITDKNAVDKNEQLIHDFTSKLPEKENEKPTLEKLKNPKTNDKKFDPSKPTCINLPFQINFAAMGIQGSNYLSKDGAALQVLAQLLTFKYLHKEIREKGGAYGGGSRYGGVDGIFSYYSYRDPHPLRSIDFFKKAGEFAISNKWTDTDLNEAKLTIFQSVDSPMDVKSEGMMMFRNSITDEMRQNRRENLLSVTIEDIKKVADKYLISGSKDVRSIAVIGPKSEEMEDWNIIDLDVD
ncbi:pitrilysin family metalloprotease ASCRUDRAFT_39067 [Ascoidea rubescens DSM 1968]|uniref:Presequence protease, mitochondrial n=1 Tax=Ascoidea rubescens DSM 1968 TaxID=1344418 RepID=A0A1D2VA52_9ASCO|nr:hypothetical protein ASCRUDRAFT_39067 [Ascoidea rubescens DSM 1968]ODV58528.1 hypothetical protein ASCRUDRAFT_39067 [Ascoidea rubescens DSM 1968]